MKTHLILTAILIIVAGYTSTAQTKANYHIDIEGGLGLSVGSTTYKYYKSLVNPNYTLEQYDSRRYRLPSAILRGTVWRQVVEKLKLGVTSGLNIHYLEINAYGNYYNALTIPVQLSGNISLLNINAKHSLESELKSGFNFQKQKFPPVIEKGGPVTSLTMVLRSKNGSNNCFILKLGYELQWDRYIFIFNSDNINDKDEKIVNTVRRKSLCLTIAQQL
jgi:hypothetical protein